MMCSESNDILSSTRSFCTDFVSDWLKGEEAELHHLCANRFEFKEFYNICSDLLFTLPKITFVGTYSQIVVEMDNRMLVITV